MGCSGNPVGGYAQGIMRNCIAWLILLSLPLPVLMAQANSGKGKAPECLEYLSRCEAHGWSGAVLVARKGKALVASGHGFADRYQAIPNGPETVFEIASITKVFTATAIMRLQEMGKLEITDSIDKHLPGVPKDKADITIAQLLSHTSGMPRSAVGGRGPDLEAAVAGYLGVPRGNKQGAREEYWNGGYALLSGVVETASGLSYEEFCNTQIFGPAGMERTGFTGRSEVPLAEQAIGYAGDEPLRHASGHPYGSYGYQYRGMGGIVTSAMDLLHFATALEEGKVIKKKTLQAMETPVTEFRGLGWAITNTTRDTRRIGHGGDVAGFHSYFLRFPDEDVVIAVLSNVDGIPAYPLAWNLESIVFGEEPKYPMPPKVVDLGAEALDALVGEYELAGRGDGSLVVEREGQGLSIGSFGLGAAQAFLSGSANGGSPGNSLEDEVRLAKRILKAVEDGDSKWLGKVIADRIPKNWAERLTQSIWPARVKERGPLKGVEVISAERQRAGAVEVLLGLDHGTERFGLRVLMRAGKLEIFDFNGPAMAHVNRFLPTSPESFQTFQWSRMAQGYAVEFEAIQGGEMVAVLVGPGDKRTRFVRR